MKDIIFIIICAVFAVAAVLIARKFRLKLKGHENPLSFKVKLEVVSIIASLLLGGILYLIYMFFVD